MSLDFDRFATPAKANEFAQEVRDTYGMKVIVEFDGRESVVCVERWKDEEEYQRWLHGRDGNREVKIEELAAEKYRARCLGT